MKSSLRIFIVRHMSKSKKASLSQPPVKPTGPVFVDKYGNVVLQILAKPGAKSNGITSIDEEGVGVQVSARPVDGEANAELIKYISSVFGLKKSEVSFDKGMKSRQKQLIISRKDLTPEKIIEKLKEEISR